MKTPLRDGFLSFLYPPKCAGCGRVGYFGLCPRCQEEADGLFAPERFRTVGGTGHADAMFALFPYQAPLIRSLLFDWKNAQYTDLPYIFRPYLEKGLRMPHFPRTIHAISYLPRRRIAHWSAGFDQAEKIAELAAALIGLPMTPLLIRQGYSRPQRKAPYEKRDRNVHGVFRPVRSFAGENILLIDDVITTGATARDGARILKGAGAMKVFVLALAR